MKSTPECWRVLLDGEELINAAGKRVKLVDDRQVNEKGYSISYNFNPPEYWSIYTPPKWCFNISEGGLMCWVGNTHKRMLAKTLYRIIVSKSDGRYVDVTGLCWDYATRLTEEEIQVFIDNLKTDEEIL